MWLEILSSYSACCLLPELIIPFAVQKSAVLWVCAVLFCLLIWLVDCYFGCCCLSLFFYFMNFCLAFVILIPSVAVILIRKSLPVLVLSRRSRFKNTNTHSLSRILISGSVFYICGLMWRWAQVLRTEKAAPGSETQKGIAGRNSEKG